MLTHTRMFSIYSIVVFNLPPTHSLEWPSVGQSDVHKCVMTVNCLSAIRFRGGVILQVSCYTLLMRIPTSMATVLLSAPHGTPFRFIGRLEQIRLSPAYLESVRLNPSSPVLLTRNGPLRILDTYIGCGVLH